MTPNNTGIGWLMDDESEVVHLWGHSKIEGHPKTGRRFTETHSLTGRTYCRHCLRHEFPDAAFQLGLFNLSTLQPNVDIYQKRGIMDVLR